MALSCKPSLTSIALWIPSGAQGYYDLKRLLRYAGLSFESLPKSEHFLLWAGRSGAHAFYL